MDQFRIPYDKLCRWLLTVKKNYRKGDYVDGDDGDDNNDDLVVVLMMIIIIIVRIIMMI